MSNYLLFPKKSRIKMFNKIILCQFCKHDIFIPYSMYLNVEEPGIGVRHVRYLLICHQCGNTKLFKQPTNSNKNNVPWSLEQYS